jgi:transposase
VPRVCAGPEGRARGYPSDLTDAQWQVIAPHLPTERPGRRGRPRIWPVRRIVEAILYLDRTGCAWRYLPTDFPPWQTVYSYFAAWRDDGTLARLHNELRAQVRAVAGRTSQPTAAVIDSQSVRAADTVPRASRGWDAAKKVNGRKRHIAVDVTGLVLDMVITAASVQDRDAARPLLWNTHRACRRVRLVWADAGYTGKLAGATSQGDAQHGAAACAGAAVGYVGRAVAQRETAWRDETG